jgi:NTP pyrophosphatase (non-canonical NTP hydrolase)
MKNEELQLKVLQWARDKDLLKSENAFKQTVKLLEEAGELAGAILKGNVEQQKDGLGDCMVVLTILANQLGTDLNYCFNLAYNEIANRTGKTVDGTFIKD